MIVHGETAPADATSAQPKAIHPQLDDEHTREYFGGLSEGPGAGEPLSLIGDSGTICSSAYAPPPSKGAASATPWPRSWSTSWWRLPTNANSPRPSPATVASTCSASTNSVRGQSTAAAPNCSFRYSPNARRPTPSPPTSSSPAGPAPSLTHVSAPRSSTDPPSPATSSRPAPPPTDSPTPGRRPRTEPTPSVGADSLAECSKLPTSSTASKSCWTRLWPTPAATSSRSSGQVKAH